MEKRPRAPTGRDSDKYILRFLPGLKKLVEDAAAASGRSINAELNARLAASFEAFAGDTSESSVASQVAVHVQLGFMRERVARLRDDLAVTLANAQAHQRMYLAFRDEIDEAGEEGSLAHRRATVQAELERMQLDSLEQRAELLRTELAKAEQELAATQALETKRFEAVHGPIVLVGNIGRSPAGGRSADIVPPGGDAGSQHRPAQKRRPPAKK